MKYQILILSCLIGFSAACRETTNNKRVIKEPWSVKMADAVMERTDSLVYLFGKFPNWSYDVALLGMSVDKLGTVDPLYSKYMQDYIDYFVKEDADYNRRVSLGSSTAASAVML